MFLHQVVILCLFSLVSHYSRCMETAKRIANKNSKTAGTRHSSSSLSFPSSAFSIAQLCFTMLSLSACFIYKFIADPPSDNTCQLLIFVYSHSRKKCFITFEKGRSFWSTCWHLGPLFLINRWAVIHSFGLIRPPKVLLTGIQLPLGFPGNYWKEVRIILIYETWRFLKFQHD